MKIKQSRFLSYLIAFEMTKHLVVRTALCLKFSEAINNIVQTILDQEVRYSKKSEKEKGLAFKKVNPF